MRYLVILDKTSLIGRGLLGPGDHDTTNAGHPVLDCKSIDMSHHHFLRVVRGPLKMQNGKTGHVALHIPYSAVVAINETAMAEEPGMGFVS